MKILIGVLIVSIGCSSKKAADASLENAALFAADPASLEGGWCRDGDPTPGSKPLRLSVVIGAGVTTDDVRAALDPARRILGRVGIELTAAAGEVVRIEDRYLLGGTIAELETVIADEGIDPTEVAAGSTRVNALVAQQVAGPLAKLLEKRAGDRGEVDVIFLERIASPLSPVQMILSNPAGLTLSPLLSHGAQSAIQVAAALHIPNRIPTVLISIRELARLPVDSRQTVVAHEIGHALGLVHQGGTENLMSENPHQGCVPGLEVGQIETLGLAAAKLTR